MLFLILKIPLDLIFFVPGTPSADSRTYLPAGGEVSVAEMEKLRASCAPLVQWLDSADDDDDDDEEED